MASARIIHFGTDDCHRLTVLRSAGYAVEDCRSLHAFREALTSDGKPEAVLITECEGSLQGDAISLSRSRTPVPLVLFRRSNGDLRDESFDLVIDSLTPPTRWLVEIDDLIGRDQGDETGSGRKPGSQSGSQSGPAALDA